MRGFHGKTMGALAATWGPEYQKPFVPMMPGLTHMPFNNFAKLETALSEETAAVLLEIVQGEGGVRVGNIDYFQRVREICNSKGVILIIDEVQTGFGRTGAMFACERFVTPDILCLAKSLAGGIPAPASFPLDLIGDLSCQVIDKYADRAFQYDLTEGFMPLRHGKVTLLFRFKQVSKILRHFSFDLMFFSDSAYPASGGYGM